MAVKTSATVWQDRAGNVPRGQWPLQHRVTWLTARQAERLLDWLEKHGYREMRVDCPDGERFRVTWSAAPA